MSVHPGGRRSFRRQRTCTIAVCLILAGPVAVALGRNNAAAPDSTPPSAAQPQPAPSAEANELHVTFPPVADTGLTLEFASDELHTPGIAPTRVKIKGRVTNSETGSAVSGVFLAGLGGGPVTDSLGWYEAVVKPGWRGTATPTKIGYIFSPPRRIYVKVTDDLYGQHYTATPVPVLAVSPADGLTSAGPQGGPFNPLSQAYIVSNAGIRPLIWSASASQSWLSLSQPAAGTLAPGASTTLTVSINAAAEELDIGAYEDSVTFTNTTVHIGDTTRRVRLSVTATDISWTNRGFDLQVIGGLAVAPWEPQTADRYVTVPRGGVVSLSIARNANLRRADGSPSPTDSTCVHIGLLTIDYRQFWTPNWELYVTDGEFMYTEPVLVGPVDEPMPVQIWNQHPGVDFDPSDWLAYGSNAIELWLIPHDLAPGNLPPVNYSNGRLPPRQLTSAPPGAWPALYRNAADELRLHNAVADLGTQLWGDGGPYDDSRFGNYWSSLSDWAAKNALVGWHTGSSTHLAEARRQLLGLLSVRTFTNECAMWSRARCVPNADFTTSYGRELSNIFFEALVTACVLGPHMTNALTPGELESVNAHLYRFAVHEIFASLTTAQYYTANGAINLHYHPICVTAGWNWGMPEAVAIAEVLPQPTHTECSYFLDDQGIGQYALRYCELHEPTDKAYEHVGNSQAVRFWLRFSEFFDQAIDVPAAERYVIDHFSGLSLDCQEALDVLMDGWQP